MLSYCRQQWVASILLAVLFLFLISNSLVYAQDTDVGAAADAGSSATDADTSNDSSSNVDSTPKEATGIPPTNEDDWGHFYDPKNVFCGKFDCYKILGFDHETWGYQPPSLKDITKSYRGLSRKWHPDKNKGKGAREKFVVSRYRQYLFLM